MGNFMGLVFATLKNEGIDTKGMSNDEAVKKFNELKGEGEGTPAEQEKLKDIENKKYKNIEYINNFSKYGDVGVNIDKLEDKELETFNSTIDGYFSKYKEMPKFTFITVERDFNSNVGGYIKEYLEEGKFVSTDLYINTEILDKYEYIEDMDRAVPNVANRFETREQRLKAIIDHEMMHKIINFKIGSKTAKRDYYLSNKIKNLEEGEVINEEFSPEQIKLREKMNKVWDEAYENGDILDISLYGSSSPDEMVAEANALMENGFDVPKNIADLVNEIKNFKREEENDR